MNLIIFNVVLLRIFECLITKEVISETNKKLMIEKNYECSIINPFFGHLFSIKMLPNLRNYYYNIIPAYKDGCIRDYVNDKESDCLSYVLISLFPTLEDDDSMTKEGNSKSMVNYFLDTRIRNTCIKSFGMLFAKIANFDEEYIDIKLMDDWFVNKLKEVFYKFKECYNDKEQVSLVLLTIHAFMVNVLNNEEEYQLYLNTILENIKSEILQSNDAFMLSNLLSCKETEKIEEKFLNELYNYNSTKILSKTQSFLYDISKLMDNIIKESDRSKDKVFKNVDSVILHLCNLLFLDEENIIYKLDHLSLDANSSLAQFYKKYSQPFEITEDVLSDWSKVVDGLENINLVSKTNNLIGKIRYKQENDKKELDVGILNIITVLTKLCMSNSNKVLEKYIEYFDQDINGYEIIKKYEDFLNVIVSYNVKISCKGDTIRKSEGDFYGIFYTMIHCEEEDKFVQTTLKFFIRLGNIECYSIRSSKNNSIICMPCVFNYDNENFSPIEYIVLKLYADITGKNIQYKESQLDNLYNNYYLNKIEQKEAYLYDLFENITNNMIDDNILKVTEMIVKTTSFTDENIKTKFLPFYLINSNLRRYRMSEFEKLFAWQQVLKKYEHLKEENYIVKLWNEEIKTLDLSKNFVDFDNLSSKSLVIACDVISNTNLSKLRIHDNHNEQYDWVRVFESLSQLRSLELIKFSGIKINFEDRCRLYKIFSDKIEQITSLNLDSLQLTSEDVEIVSKLLKTKNNKINFLDLSNNNLGSDSMNILCDALKNENNIVDQIYLDTNNFGSIGAVYLSDVIKHQNNKVKVLRLGFDFIANEGIKDLSEALKHENNKVTQLFLNSNNIGFDGIKYVSSALTNANNKLKKLYLSNKNISDESAKYIFNALKDNNNRLKMLDMSHSKLRIASYIIDALFNEYCQLERLSLESCGLDDKELGKIWRQVKKIISPLQLLTE